MYKIIRICSSVIRWIIIVSFTAVIVECLAPQWMEQNRTTMVNLIGIIPTGMAIATLAITSEDWRPTTTWCVVSTITWAIWACLRATAIQANPNFWNISSFVGSIVWVGGCLFFTFQARKERKKQPKNP